MNRATQPNPPPPRGRTTTNTLLRGPSHPLPKRASWTAAGFRKPHSLAKFWRPPNRCKQDRGTPSHKCALVMSETGTICPQFAGFRLEYSYLYVVPGKRAPGPYISHHHTPVTTINITTTTRQVLGRIPGQRMRPGGDSGSAAAAGTGGHCKGVVGLASWLAGWLAVLPERHPVPCSPPPFSSLPPLPLSVSPD